MQKDYCLLALVRKSTPYGQKDKDMTQFDANYDREKLATVEDIVALTGKPALLVNKALKDAGLVSAGHVRTGRVGKPPRLFDRAEFLAAIAAYEDQRSTLRAARASARTRPAATAAAVVVATVPPPANDDEATQASPAAVVFGE
jgi:hypothetical protein